jgi:hypothetical protein
MRHAGADVYDLSADVHVAGGRDRLVVADRLEVAVAERSRDALPPTAHLVGVSERAAVHVTGHQLKRGRAHVYEAC